jgi:uncharacterized protein YggT (Ycf19 family)
MAQFEPRGTVNASVFGATEGVLLLAAAVETSLIAGLALTISRVGVGSTIGTFFLRLNDFLLGPFALIPSFGTGAFATVGRQSAAVLGYGLFFLLLISGVSWFDRRRVSP